MTINHEPVINHEPCARLCRLARPRTMNHKCPHYISSTNESLDPYISPHTSALSHQTSALAPQPSFILHTSAILHLQDVTVLNRFIRSVLHLHDHRAALESSYRVPLSYRDIQSNHWTIRRQLNPLSTSSF